MTTEVKRLVLKTELQKLNLRFLDITEGRAPGWFDVSFDPAGSDTFKVDEDGAVWRIMGFEPSGVIVWKKKLN
jgi:hypothetical protein